MKTNESELNYFQLITWIASANDKPMLRWGEFCATNTKFVKQFFQFLCKEKM